jgi:N-acetyl-anhydromuramyl-L-alanine amidase AmpD
MSITNNFIDGIAKKTLVHVGANQTPKLLVIHYSVTDTVAKAVTALNAAKLSYHILIEKDGKAFQTRRFTETAAHPGLSNWKSDGGLTMGASVSRGSIGICLMNKGFAFGSSPNAPGKLVYNPDDPSMQRWETYPKALIDSCSAIASDVIAEYGITDVVGHHDVAIMGKFDPGPLFDFAPLIAKLANPPPPGLASKVKVPAGEKLTVRRGPDASSPKVLDLDNGTPLHVRSVAYGPRTASILPSPPSLKRYLTRWASVDVDGSGKHAGYVNMKFLTKTPLSPELAAHL